MVTDVVVGAIHLDNGSVVHLNDDPPDASKFTRMWQDLATLRSQGVHVLAFVGGAAAGASSGSKRSSTPTTRCCAT